MGKVFFFVVMGIFFLLGNPADCQAAAGPEKESPANTAEAFIEQQRAAGRKPNRLLNEKSPYLLKHAFNPVDWFPWGEEAFAKARQENKPILLSIGYATCHWCNVMEEESFDNAAVAGIINDHFVAVKVDREERPDIDSAYLAVTQAMTGSAGWPMTIFLTPQLQPFFAGTYFPEQARFGLPGFGELLQSVAAAWRDRGAELVRQAEKILAELQDRQRTASPAEREIRPAEILPKAYGEFLRRFDAKNGGFGAAPKFPGPPGLSFLLRYHWRDRGSQALPMAAATLRAMASGGIRDHLAGGFHRYAVDAGWRTPHFEKMLYDQAQLAQVYLEAFQLTGESFFRRTAEEILDFVRQEMTGPEGGFYSALDADSPRPENIAAHGEGAYYLWRQEEIDALLGGEAAAVFSRRYGITGQGNLNADPLGEFAGRNILYLAGEVDTIAGQSGKTAPEVDAVLTEGRRRLLKARALRPRPYLDDKVIAAWNGLMISAFVKGYQVTGKDYYLAAARQAAAFLLTRLYDPATDLLSRRYRDGQAGIDGQLADYAFLTQALLDLFQVAPELSYLRKAEKLAAAAITIFTDQKTGGLFETRPGSVLPLQPRPVFESAEPSGNAVAALNFVRLSRLTGQQKWQVAAAGILKAFADLLDRDPSAMPGIMVALDASSRRPEQIVIAGASGSQEVRRMQNEVFSRFLPYATFVLADGGEVQDYLARGLPALASMRPVSGRATVYVCENFTCKTPVNDPVRLRELLDERQHEQPGR